MSARRRLITAGRRLITSSQRAREEEGLEISPPRRPTRKDALSPRGRVIYTSMHNGVVYEIPAANGSSSRFVPVGPFFIQVGGQIPISGFSFSVIYSKT